MSFWRDHCAVGVRSVKDSRQNALTWGAQGSGNSHSMFASCLCLQWGCSPATLLLPWPVTAESPAHLGRVYPTGSPALQEAGREKLSFPRNSAAGESWRHFAVVSRIGQPDPEGRARGQ